MQGCVNERFVVLGASGLVLTGVGPEHASLKHLLINPHALYHRYSHEVYPAEILT
jgi:hypothetical protein